MNILLIDDEPLVLSALRRLLQGRQHDVTTFATASEALVCLSGATVPVDVVVSDFSLGAPENGLDFLDAVRDHSPEVLRVLMSGELHVEGLRAALSDGVIDAFVGKSDINELSRVLEGLTRPSRRSA